MARRTADSSTDLTTTPFNDGLRVGDGMLGLAQGVEVDRGASLEPIWIPGGDVVLVQLLGPVDQLAGWPDSLWQAGQQDAERVAPSVEVTSLEDSLDRLLGGLVRRKCRPVVVAGVLRVSSVPEIRLRLPEPIERAFGHLVTITSTSSGQALRHRTSSVQRPTRPGRARDRCAQH